MMPLEIHRGPCPPENQGASNPLVRRGAGPETSWGLAEVGAPGEGEAPAH